MSKKLKLGLVLIVAMLTCVLFVVFASAETYTVKYADIGGGGSISYADTDENGKITLRETSVSTNANKEFYGWFADDGTFYKSGQEITITENITLREAYAIVVTDLAGLQDQLAQKNVWSLIRLDADLDLTESTGRPGWKDGGGAQIYLDLNGHTIEYTGTATLFTSTRLGLHLLNSSSTEAKIIANNIAENSAIIEIGRHGYGDGKNLTFSVGRNVNVETNSALYRVPGFYYSATSTGGNGDLCPYISIWGTVKARTLVNGNSQSTHLADLNIYSGANVTFTGKTWWENAHPTIDAHFADLMIEDGTTIITNNPNFKWLPSIDFLKYVEYNVVGGVYSTKFPVGILKNGYEAVYNADTELYEVKYVACTTDGSNGTHTFKVQEALDDMLATCTASGLHYYRCDCGSAYVDDVPALGHSYTVITIEKIATLTEKGVKKVTCERCDDSYTYEYSFDPRDQLVTIVVKTENGTKEITATVGDIYDITVAEAASGFTSRFNGVKTITDPDDAEVTYKIANIVKLVIPAGVTEIAAGSIKNATELTDIVLLDGANATFATRSIDNCTKLSKISLGECTVVFSDTTINGNTANFELDVANANVTFNSRAFQGKAVTKLTLGKDKYYNFGENSFNSSKLESLVLPDGSTPIANGGESLVTFPGAAAFYGCPNLKYVYIGANIIAPNNEGEIRILNKPFDCAYALEKVVLMDITYIDQYVFCCAAAGNTNGNNREMSTVGLTVYHHASKLSINGNAFVNRTYYGVTLYTTASITSLANCKYTVYKGIPHAYTEGNIEETCTAMGSTGYKTDCACGVVSNATYTIYSTANADINETSGSITINNPIPALGHDFCENDTDKQIIVSQTPATCIKDATIVYKCIRCDETLTVVQEGTATGHNVEGVEWEITTQVTCVTDGLKQKICKDCKALAESEIVPAIGHEATGVWVPTTEANCTMGATKVQYCKNDGCGFVMLTETTEPNGHTPSNNWIIEVNASCVKDGSRYQRCSTCNAICTTEVIEKFGHEFGLDKNATVISIAYPNGFNEVGVADIECARCDETSEAEALAIFEALGYSVGPDGYSVKMGFTVNVKALNDYKAFYPTFEFGMLFINANSVATTESFFDGSALNATAKGIKVEVEGLKYVTINADLRGFNASNAGALELVMGIYTIDKDGKTSVIQYVDATNYATNKTYADLTLNVVNFNQVRLAHGLEALVPVVTTGDEQ